MHKIVHVTMRDRLWEALNQDALDRGNSTNAHIREILANYYRIDPEIVPRPKPRRFTDREKEYVREHIRFTPEGRARNIKAIAKKLNRPPTSVSRLVENLGVRPRITV